MMKSLKLSGKLSLRKWLDNKRFTVPLSIVLAFSLWLIIMINQNPDVERTFTNIPININLENTYASENGMEIIGDLSRQKFSVKIDGPSYVVSALTATDFYLYASAAAINEPGEYQLDVVGAKNTAVTDYEIVSISPSSVKVSFDYVETKEFTLKAVAEGAAAEKGLIAEAAVVSGTESDTITIQGPRTVVNKIDSAVAYTEVNETLSESRTFNADIHLYDADGKELDMTNLTLSTTKVQVTVPIAKRATVPVVAEFTNLPSDFSKSSLSYQIDHSSVTVIGTPSTIDEIKQVTLSPIDITNVSTSSNRFDVSAKLPDGVRLLDSIETFTVTIDTSDYKVAVFNISDVHFTHLSSGLKASSDSVIKNVKICGPSRVIAKLKESTLYAEADLTDKVAGEHTVAVSVKSDNIHNIWQVGSYSTTVKIQ